MKFTKGQIVKVKNADSVIDPSGNTRPNQRKLYNDFGHQEFKVMSYDKSDNTYRLENVATGMRYDWFECRIEPAFIPTTLSDSLFEV